MSKYKKGIEFIALNDEDGAEFAEDVETVESQMTVQLMSEIFNRHTLDIARDVVKFRKKENKVNAYE